MKSDQSEVIIWSRDLVLTNHNSPDHLVEGDVARELLILGAGGAVVGELLLDGRLETQRINVKAEWRLLLLELSMSTQQDFAKFHGGRGSPTPLLDHK